MNVKRWWGVRHIRWFYHSIRLAQHVEHCRAVGLGIAANPADIRQLERIREGQA